MKRRLCIVGFGKMGEAIFRGLRAQSPGPASAPAFELTVCVRDDAKAASLQKELGCPVSTDLPKLAAAADLVVLCVKPQQALEVLQGLERQWTETQTLISICAGLSLATLRQALGARPFVARVMPNTPCLVGQGVSVLSFEKNLESLPQAKEVEGIFGVLGKTFSLAESLMDGATGISGCGPAYVYMILDALSDAGVKVGLSRKVATQLAAHTFLGSTAMLLQRDVHPAALKDEVTTPGGVTVDALMALEEGNLRVTLIKAVVAAAERSRKLMA